MIINDLDLGPFFVPVGGGILQSNAGSGVGQNIGTSLIYGDKTILWPTGSTERVRKETVYIEAPTSIAGSTPGGQTALRYLIIQLRQIVENARNQPVYIQWRSGNGQVIPDFEDGWWIIKSFQPNMESEANGWAPVDITSSFIAAASPASLATYYTGGTLSSTYSSASTILVGFPIGSTGFPFGFGLTRSGGEGTIPVSYLSATSTLNPVPFVRPGTVAGLFQGDVKVFDTFNTSTFPVPIGSGFANNGWLRVYGAQHNFIGDCVITNGLLLLLFQPGLGNICQVYFWNTQGTPGWRLFSPLWYKDNSLNIGTLREINLLRVSSEEVRLKAVANTPGANNWAQLFIKLTRASYAFYINFLPLTQTVTTAFALSLGSLANTNKIDYDESSVVDVVTSPSTNVAPSTSLGFGGSFGKTTNDPLFGWLFQNAPSLSQGLSSSTSELANGDASGPAINSFRTYGVYIVPFPNISNLQAEAEGGVLGTGWTSIADANASNGNTAKAASGTLANNANIFGVIYLPATGMYDVWYRVRVTSTAGAVGEMTLGLRDATTALFVSGSATTLRANQASTSYVWIKVNLTVPLSLPVSGHSIQFFAITSATLGTDWFIDEAVLAPIRSPTLGQGNFPGDIWSQWLFDKDTRWTRG